jgi:hypothetical protein
VPKSTTAKNEAVDGGIKTTADAVDYRGTAYHYGYTAKYDGKDYARDGKVRTVTTTGVNPQGQKVNNVVAWEKQ